MKKILSGILMFISIITLSVTIVHADGKDNKYFKALSDIKVYDNRTGVLVEIGSLKEGQVYVIHSDYGNWYRIEFGDYYGYVHKSKTTFLKNASIKNLNKSYKSTGRILTAKQDVTVYDNSTGSLTPFATITKGTQVRYATDYGNWWRITIGGLVGYIHKTAVDVQFTKTDKYFEVINDNVAVYDNRTGALIKIGELKKGQTYPRVSDYGNWHRIQFGNYYGYVHKGHTIPSNKSKLKNENTSIKLSNRTLTTLTNVPVYDNSSGQLVPFVTLEKDIKLTIISDYGNWWRVLVSNRIGFVHKKSVKADFLPGDRYFKPLNDLSIYDNRSGSLVEVGKVYKDISYPIVSDYGKWWRINFGNYYGYVRKESTQYSDGSDITNPKGNLKNSNQSFRAKTDIAVYDNSKGNLKPIGMIKEGVVFPIANDYGNWWKIIFNDLEAYVHKSGVEPSLVIRYKEYNYSLEDALNIQMKKSPQTDKYRNQPIWVQSEHFEIINSGAVINGDNVRVRTNPNDKSAPVAYTLNSGTKIEILEKGISGFEYNGSTEWYKIRYNNDKRDLYVHSTLVSEGGKMARINKGETTANVNLRYSPNTKENPYKTVSSGTKFTFVRTVSGESVNGSTTWYEIIYENKTLYVHSSLAKLQRVNYYEGPSTNHHLWGSFSTFNNLQILEQSGSWLKLNYNPSSWRNAKREDVLKYLNPSTQDDFQHLVLAESTGISAYELNKVLIGKGVLSGKGQAFVQAGTTHGVNEVYLVSHALLETGNGTSPLAKGVEVGLNSKGNPVLVTSSNRGSLINIRTVYNMYGIGAYDTCPLDCGAIEAYNRGWFSIETAIIGGASFVSDSYFARGQNTLYKMRWNPDNPGSYQYATDIGWAAKQIGRIKELYNQLDNVFLIFEIPVYKK